MRIKWTLAIALLALGACKDLTTLEQESPSRVRMEELLVPGNAQLLVTGAISDFECALSNYVVAAGLVGDELIDAQLSQVGWDYDRRTIIPSLVVYATRECGNVGTRQSPGMYTPISVARFQADTILRALQTWTDAEVSNRTDLIAQAAAHAGYSLILLGEGMCTAAIDGGPELTRAEIFAEAEERFEVAMTAAQASNNASILNMARVGFARALLNQNRLAEARDTAARVPSTFVRNATYSAANVRRENLVHQQLLVGLYSSVDPTFRGLADPRVPVAQLLTPSGQPQVGQDRATAIWATTKYPTLASPIPIASYDEAQLIVAEAAAASGTQAGADSAVAIINVLHTRAGIPAYAGGTPAQVQAQVREERRRELFLEGQRLGDIIRYDLTLSPAQGTAYPVKGGVYGSHRGSQLCFPLPDVERNNNPTIQGS